MSPDFIKGLDMLRQMQALNGCCDTQPPVVVYRDRPARSFSIPEPGTPWWQTAKDCGAWTDRKDGDVGYVHFGSVEALRVYTVKVTRQALAAAAPQAPQQAEPWQPIETAPKDAVVLLAAEFDCPGDWRIKCGTWIPEEKAWRVWGASWIPTRWMPLPAPPATPAA